MKWLPVFSVIVLALPSAGQEHPAADRLTAGSVRVPRPPVLEGAEPADSVVVTLPGARVGTSPVSPIPSPAPDVPKPAPVDPEEDHRPVLRRAPKPVLPAEFERDSAAFSQKMIGLWTQPDAYNLFGEPLRERPVLDGEVESGRVYAFSDPTDRYREIELDFARDTGLLRTVFVYPWKMSWLECRRLWGENVRPAQANKGRKFYSYVNRRVDVLVDSAGNVISLGFY
jgi:hypothetical protein